MPTLLLIFDFLTWIIWYFLEISKNKASTRNKPRMISSYRYMLSGIVPKILKNRLDKIWIMIVGLIDLYFKAILHKTSDIKKLGIISINEPWAKLYIIEEAITAKYLPYLLRQLSKTPLKAYSSKSGVSIKKANKYNGSFISSVLKVIPIEDTTPLSIPKATAKIVVIYIAPKDIVKKTTKSISICETLIFDFLKKILASFLQYNLNNKNGNIVPKTKHNKELKNIKL